jgi:hypothetical protein
MYKSTSTKVRTKVFTEVVALLVISGEREEAKYNSTVREEGEVQKKAASVMRRKPNRS